MPLRVNSALGHLKYVVSMGSAFCASSMVLSSAFYTPVDDVTTKKTLNLPLLGLQLDVACATTGSCLVP